MFHISWLQRDIGLKFLLWVKLTEICVYLNFQLCGLSCFPRRPLAKSYFWEKSQFSVSIISWGKWIVSRRKNLWWWLIKTAGFSTKPFFYLRPLFLREEWAKKILVLIESMFSILILTVRVQKGVPKECSTRIRVRWICRKPQILAPSWPSKNIIFSTSDREICSLQDKTYQIFRENALIKLSRSNTLKNRAWILVKPTLGTQGLRL